MIYYLVRSYTRVTGLYFPDEIDLANYATIGSFFIMGPDGHTIGDIYSFYAIRRGQLFSLALNRLRGSQDFFEATVQDIGRFVFYAERLTTQYRYLGSDGRIANTVALRRLRAWDTDSLEIACKKHDFYFVGYSQGMVMANET